MATEAKKVNAREWYTANKDTLRKIVNSWFLPRKWRTLLNNVLDIADGVFVAYRSPFSIEVTDEN